MTPDFWYRGTALPDGRVELDDYSFFVAERPFILEPEEIADWRSAPQRVDNGTGQPVAR